MPFKRSIFALGHRHLTHLHPGRSRFGPQWPTSCVEANDAFERYVGNHHNVGIYQRTFGYGYEAAASLSSRPRRRHPRRVQLGISRDALCTVHDIDSCAFSRACACNSTRLLGAASTASGGPAYDALVCP